MAIKVAADRLTVEPGFGDGLRAAVADRQTVGEGLLVPVVDAEVEGAADAPGPVWVATEYVEAPSLDRLVSVSGPLSPEDVRVLASGLAAALAALHAAGVVHRDLTPSRVLMTPDGPRLLDFGIVRALDATSLSRTDLAGDDPGKLCPEEILGAPVTEASDVFALGVVLCHAATGAGPFDVGEVTSAYQRALAHHRVVREEPDLAGVSAPDLRALIADCLAKDPAARPTSARLSARLGQADKDMSEATEERSPAVAVQQRPPAVEAALAVPLAPPPPPLPSDRADHTDHKTVSLRGIPEATGPSEVAHTPVAYPSTTASTVHATGTAPLSQGQPPSMTARSPLSAPIAPWSEPAPPPPLALTPRPRQRRRPRSLVIGALVTALAVIGTVLVVLEPWEKSDDVPSAFLGAWDGTVVSQADESTDPTRSHEVHAEPGEVRGPLARLVIDKGRIGDVVAEIVLQKPDSMLICTWETRLLAVDEDDKGHTRLRFGKAKVASHGMSNSQCPQLPAGTLTERDGTLVGHGGLDTVQFRPSDLVDSESKALDAFRGGWRGTGVAGSDVEVTIGGGDDGLDVRIEADRGIVQCTYAGGVFTVASKVLITTPLGLLSSRPVGTDCPTNLPPHTLSPSSGGLTYNSMAPPSTTGELRRA